MCAPFNGTHRCGALPLPALQVPLLPTPPFLSVLLLFLFLFPSEVSKQKTATVWASLSLPLSFPQPHNVGCVKTLLAHSQDISAAVRAAKAVRGHTVERVCVRMTVSHTHTHPLAGGLFEQHHSSRRPRPDAPGRSSFLWNIPLSPTVLASVSCSHFPVLPSWTSASPHTPMSSTCISPPPHPPIADPLAPAPRPRQVDSLWVSWRTTFHYLNEDPAQKLNCWAHRLIVASGGSQLRNNCTQGPKELS